MRVNSIMPSLMTKVYKSKNVDSPETTIEKPIATDTVQFKGDPYCIQRLKELVNRGRGYCYSVDKRHKIENEQKIKALMRDFAEALDSFPDCYKHPAYEKVARRYLKNNWFSTIGNLAKDLKLETDEFITLVHDSKNRPCCIIKNLGAYDFLTINRPQSALILTIPGTTRFVAFSNAYSKGVSAVTTELERHEFYSTTNGHGYQYKSRSTQGFFPVMFDSYYNEDGSLNKFNMFLSALRIK